MPETSGNVWSFLWLSQNVFLSVNFENIRIGTSLNILVTQNSKTKRESIFRARNMLHRKNVDATQCKKTMFCFQNKAGSELHGSPHIYLWIRRSIYGYIWIRQYENVLYMWASMKFLPKAVYRAEDRPTDTCLKMTFT